MRFIERFVCWLFVFMLAYALWNIARLVSGTGEVSLLPVVSSIATTWMLLRSMSSSEKDVEERELR